VTAAIALATVVVLALASLGARLVLDRRTAPPAGPPAPRYMVSSYGVVAPADSAANRTRDDAYRAWTFNVAQRRYVPLPLPPGSFPEAVSADGSRIMLVAGSGHDAPAASGLGVISLADLVAGRTDAVRALRWPSSLSDMRLHESPTFSPDGHTALIPVVSNVTLVTGFVVADVVTGDCRLVELDGGPYQRSNPIMIDFSLFWAPGGRGVTLYQRSDWKLGGAASLRLFDLAGHPTRLIRLPAPVEPFHDDGASWSPDGQHLVFGYYSVLDLATGSVREMTGGQASESYSDHNALWYDDSHLLLLYSSGNSGRPQLQVLDTGTRQVVRRVALTAPGLRGAIAGSTAVVLVPLTGPAPAGAIVI